MNKKASFIAGIIFVSVALLLFYAIRSFQCPSSEITSASQTASVAAAAATEPVFEATDGTVATTFQSTEAPADTTVSGSVFSDDIRSSRFVVSRVVDVQAVEEVSPRVALGASYTDCYLSFDDNAHVELYLSTATGNVREGTYELFDDIISVTYSDGKGAEYSILSNEGGFAGITVPYGEYIVTFTK